MGYYLKDGHCGKKMDGLVRSLVRQSIRADPCWLMAGVDKCDLPVLFKWAPNSLTAKFFQQRPKAR